MLLLMGETTLMGVNWQKDGRGVTLMQVTWGCRGEEINLVSGCDWEWE